MKGRHSITKLCKALNISHNQYYYRPRESQKDEELAKAIKAIFEKNRRCYGQRKLYKAVRLAGISVSKERLSRIVKKEGLKSRYVQRRKPRVEGTVNKDEVENKIGRKFVGKKRMEVVVSDMSYVEISKKWHYICLLVELSHREIIGYSVGKNRDAELVRRAWQTVRSDIREISYFHTDRGSEYKNDEIDKILKAGKIERSLSRAGTPIDNAVAESMYSIVKTEFIYGERFEDLGELQRKLSGWVWWYNNERLHSSLGYICPAESRKRAEVGVTEEKMANKKYQKFWRKVSLHTQDVQVADRSQDVEPEK